METHGDTSNNNHLWNDRLPTCVQPAAGSNQHIRYAENRRARQAGQFSSKTTLTEIHRITDCVSIYHYISLLSWTKLGLLMDETIWSCSQVTMLTATTLQRFDHVGPGRILPDSLLWCMRLIWRYELYELRVATCEVHPKKTSWVQCSASNKITKIHKHSYKHS